MNQPSPLQRLPWITFQRLDAALLFATLLASAVAMSANLADPDLWGHVQYGRDLLRDGLPATNTYSYTAPGYRWINHENLAEVVLAIAADTIGPTGMLGLKCLLGLGIIGLILSHAYRRGVALLAMCVVALLVSVNLAYFWSLRPQLASFTLFALLLTLLGWCFAGWEGHCWLPGFDRSERLFCYSSRRMRYLWLGPLILGVWANSHGGFVAGFCVFAAYLCCRSVEVVLQRGWAARGLLVRFAMMIAAAALATFLNPYGPGLHRWLAFSLGSPRPEILEWHPPDFTSPLMLPLALLLMVWFSVLLLTRRSRDCTHLAIMALLLWQTLEHVRHVPFLALAFGFWMAIHVDSVLRRFRVVATATTVGRDLTPRVRMAFALAVGLALVGVSAQLVHRLSVLKVDRAEYPVAAFQYIADQELQGKMVVTFNWAQYAINAFGAETDQDTGIQVSFDGRFRTCYPQQIVDMNFDFILGTLEPRFRGPQSPPFDDTRVLEYGSPDLVLISRRQPHSVNVMFRNRDRWTLLYQDQVAQLWGRSSVYDDPQSARFLAENRRHISEDPQKGSVPWPALPTPANSLSMIAVK